MKILVVDDESDIASLFRQKFRQELKEGILSFHFCFSAEEALLYLNSVSAADVVLILSDINMPGMNGIELLRVIKERRPTLSVFMITAYDEADKHDQAKRLGADEYLTKPIDFQALRARLFASRNPKEKEVI
jgi:CheY-like chemotaxis protein